MILSCWRATYFSSIKSFKKLNIVRRIQLWLHLSMCKDCHEFDHQSQLIDNSLSHLQNSSTPFQSEESLSTEKTAQIKDTVNQYLN